MKKSLIIAATIFAANSLSAQTLRVNIGDVTYAIPASQTGEMLYDAGKTLTIGKKTFTLSDLTNITIDNAIVEDNTVDVKYDGSSAKVVIAGNIAPYVNAKVKGAHVSIEATTTLDQRVKYTLSGNTQNGSFYMSGSYPMEVVFNGVTLNNPDSAAVNLQNGKLIEITLPAGTTSNLSDGLTSVTDDGSDGHKAAFYADGHTSWSGSGSMNIKGNVKHGLSDDEYMLLNEGMGTLTISGAINDGLHVSQYFKMLGGTVKITSSGDGIDVEKKKSDKEDNGMLTIEGGNLTVVTTGNATKALKCESNMVIKGGVISATTSGTATYDSSLADPFSSNAAAKCDGEFLMSGGTLNLTSTGAGGKGLNSTGNITINGGTLTVVTTGAIFAYGSDDTKPQAIKSDGNITLSGGTILSCASPENGNPFKTDLNVYTNGATLMGIGDKSVTPTTSSTCGFKNYKGVKVAGGSSLSYDGVSFTIPSIYSNSNAKVIVSSPSIKK